MFSKTSQIRKISRAAKINQGFQRHNTQHSNSTCGSGGAGGGAPGCALAGSGAHCPLHGARGLSGAVGMGRARGSLERFVQQVRLLIGVIALTATAVRVTRVVRLGVVLGEKGRHAAGTFRTWSGNKLDTNITILTIC